MSSRILHNAEQFWSFYVRHRAVLSPLLFLAGFFSGVGSKRIDLLWNQVILSMQLVLGSGCLILLGRSGTSDRLRNGEAWFRGFGYFFIGGMMSTHVTYYFQSAAGIKAMTFLGSLFMLVLFVERIKRRFPEWYLMWGLYFLCLSSYIVFFVPVITRKMSAESFYASLTAGLAMGTVLLASGGRGVYPFWKTWLLLATMSAALAGLYASNFIPPVPLALKQGGIYHRVEREAGQYKLAAEPGSDWFRMPTYHYAPGDTVVCFTAIFAPTSMTQSVLHRWERYVEGEWRIVDQLRYDLVGGRDGGYRGYTAKTGLAEGEWRVDVVTEEGLLIGRIRFDMRPAQTANRTFETIVR